MPVRGTVTYHGKPLPYGLVKFQPADAARGRAAVATIAPNGNYAVQTVTGVSGLVPGDYMVTVAVVRPPGLEKMDLQATRNDDAEKLPSEPVSGFTLSVESGAAAKVFDIAIDRK